MKRKPLTEKQELEMMRSFHARNAQILRNNGYLDLASKADKQAKVFEDALTTEEVTK